MSRVQLALNVSDLDKAVAFYSKLFATEPAKLRPGYANFAIAEPPLKLVLIEGHGDPGSLNHLGVEVTSTSDVAAAEQRLASEGLATATEDEVSCCSALQDKVWVDGPGQRAVGDLHGPCRRGDAGGRVADGRAHSGDRRVARRAPESAARCC